MAANWRSRRCGVILLGLMARTYARVSLTSMPGLRQNTMFGWEADQFHPLCVLLVFFGLFEGGCATIPGDGTGQVPRSPSFTVTTTSLGSAQFHIPFESSTSSGGTSAYPWSIISGSLPSALSETAKTGTIAGQPTATGSYGFTVQVQDSSSPIETASKALVINVKSS